MKHSALPNPDYGVGRKTHEECLERMLGHTHLSSSLSQSDPCNAVTVVFTKKLLTPERGSPARIFEPF